MIFFQSLLRLFPSERMFCYSDIVMEQPREPFITLRLPSRLMHAFVIIIIYSACSLFEDSGEWISCYGNRKENLIVQAQSISQEFSKGNFHLPKNVQFTILKLKSCNCCNCFTNLKKSVQFKSADKNFGTYFGGTEQSEKHSEIQLPLVEY